MIIMVWMLVGILIGWMLHASVDTIQKYVFQRDLKDLMSAAEDVLYDPECAEAQDWLYDSITRYWDKYGSK